MQAGLRLSILPVALAVLAPIGGALYDRLGPRLPACCGALLCLEGLVLLYLSSTARPAGCR